MITKPKRTLRAPRIEWPTAVVLAFFLSALVAVWALASPEQRDSMLGGVGALGVVVLSIMRAMLAAPEPEPTPGNGLDRNYPLKDDRR